MKKISFSFMKSKPASARPTRPQDETKKDIQFIDCIESNAIKVKGATETKKEGELIIPVKNDKPIRIGDTKVNDENIEKVTCNSNVLQITDIVETLDDVAVREILEDSQRVKESASSSTLNVIPTTTQETTSVKEATLEDYDNVPVTDFGMAMLRGMGWKPEKGIGKNERVIEPTFPILRPKGMGLGAEKRKIPVLSSESEDLSLKKGAYVQVLAGSHKHTYGEVQSFDEDAGRVIIKTALGGSNISVNESMIEVVSKNEYKRSSRVLNQSKYEECKRREELDESTVSDSRFDSSEYKRRRKHDFQETNGRRYSKK